MIFFKVSHLRIILNRFAEHPFQFVGNFPEAYRNLPYKHVMALRWAANHNCIQTKFIIKMDDDIVVDLYRLTKYLHSLETRYYGQPIRHFLGGYVFSKVVPIRKHQNKWFVTNEEFSGDMYPDYLSGWLYVTTPYTAKLLTAAASKADAKIFWIDDTWITGILRDNLKLPINDTLNALFSANSQFLDCCINDITKHQYRCPFIAGPNGGDHKLVQKLSLAIRTNCYKSSSNLGKNDCHDRPANIPSLKKTCVGSDKHLLMENHGSAVISAIRL